MLLPRRHHGKTSFTAVADLPGRTFNECKTQAYPVQAATAASKRPESFIL